MKKAVLLFVLLLSVVSALNVGLPLCHAQETLQVLTPNVSTKITTQSMTDDMVVVSVTDAKDDPVKGLGIQDFAVRKGDETATIISVEPLETSTKVSLNLLLVLDNSTSMSHRKAVEPLLSALEKVLAIVRPVDNVQVVVFDAKASYVADGRALHAKLVQSSDVPELRRFLQQAYSDLIIKTYLYEGILTGLDRARALPEKENKLLVVFSDGEDINSAFGTKVVQAEAKKVKNLKVYAIDFMPSPEKDPFLKSLAESHDGAIWKATAANELLAIFERLATSLKHQYVISYRFQPRATIEIEPAAMTIEEVTTVDTSPLLNYVYFDTGNSEMPDRYVVYENQAQAQAFDDTALRTTMDKYINLLNIIGKRLRERPEASITIVGCNSDVGEEQGRTDLSRARAEAVRLYLKYLWGIDPSRMEVQARKLPEFPSTNRIPEGRVENQRAEILSNNPEILDTVKSVYMEARSDVERLTITPKVATEHGLTSWKLTLVGTEEIYSTSGTGPLDPVYSISTREMGLDKLAKSPQIMAAITVVDEKGQEQTAQATSPVTVTLIKKEQLLAQKMGYKVLEKYALILFDYDSSEIKGDNEIILGRIVARMLEFPNAFVRITGHTDTIGEEAYNIKLSQRRAKAVYDSIMSTGVNPEAHITYLGVGPQEPLYENTLPEGRALNRTVTIDLEYEKTE